MIKDDNKRFSIVLPKHIYRKLQEQACFEDRSISKMAAIIIKDYYAKKDLKDNNK